MGTLTKEQIEKLAHLCRIHPSEEEKEALLHDLQRILSLIKELQDLDTTEFPPCHHVLADMNNVARDDTVGPTLPRDIYLRNAPDQIGGMVRIPPLLAKEGKEPKQ